MSRKTKIVCTIGPAVDSRDQVDKLVASGMNVARLNCSHGTWEDRKRWISWIRESAAKRSVHVGILIDLQGPKFRLGKLPENGLRLEPGQKIRVGSQKGDLPIPQPEVLNALVPGKTVLTGDGDVAFKVLSHEKGDILLICTSGGIVRTRQGITVVGMSFDIPPITQNDIQDIEIASELEVDFIAVSYVRNAEDMIIAGEYVEKFDPRIQLIAKIEMRSAVKDIENIIAQSDGVMIARGDMGLQMAIEEVPLVQKKIISLCRSAGKPVITATQMMESMIANPRPTRAEATDVANAIIDGTDAIMLSGETAFGKHPIESLQYMERIADKTERSSLFAKALHESIFEKTHDTTRAVAHSACNMAQGLRAKAILCFSTSGFTARMVSKYRPRVDILGVTYLKRTASQMTLLWGVQPILTSEFGGTDEMINMGFKSGVKQGKLQIGDLVVITAGLPVGRPGTTNLVLLLEVSEGIV